MMNWVDTAKAGAKWKEAEQEKEKQREAERGAQDSTQSNRSDELRRKPKENDSKKPQRSEHRNLVPGAIFIGEHCEGAGDWSEPTTDTVDGLTEKGITTGKSHNPTFIKDRKFIVLFVHIHQYVCIPPFTYNKEGAIGKIDQNDHVSVVDFRGRAPPSRQ